MAGVKACFHRIPGSFETIPSCAGQLLVVGTPLPPFNQAPETFRASAKEDRGNHHPVHRAQLTCQQSLKEKEIEATYRTLVG